MSLYHKHRPKLFKQVIGQPEAIRMLEEFVKRKKIPHAILFSGPSGVGKTTLARILKTKLNCSDADFSEINCADFRGIDTVREIRQRMSLSPINGTCRIWLLDEIHKATGDALTGLLKLIEDFPPHVYFFLCTTDPNKLLKTIITRCTEIKLKPVADKQLGILIESICDAEHLKISETVVDKLIQVSDGSARKALVLLDQIIYLEEDEQRKTLENADSKRNAIEIARCLLNPKAKWADISKIIKDVDEEPEILRHMILSYASTVILNGGKLADRAYLIITAFEGHFFDSKRAGLIRACYEVFGSK